MLFIERHLRILTQAWRSSDAVPHCGGSMESFCAQDQQLRPSETQVNPADLVKEIRVIGNDTITASQVAGHLTTRVGRPFDRSIVQRDVRRLANLGWFIDVKPLYEATPQGHIVIFQVVERPTIRYVTVSWNTKCQRQETYQGNRPQIWRSGRSLCGGRGASQDRGVLPRPRFNNAQVTILRAQSRPTKGFRFLSTKASQKDLER